MRAADVRLYRDADWAGLMQLATALFPQEPSGEIAESMRGFLRRADGAVFVAERPDGTLSGYVQVGERPSADGCWTSPVGYIEEWYVDPDARRAGIGRALLGAAEEWAHGRGLTEMASDALLDNTVSHRAHERAGYEEVERAIRFRKLLVPKRGK
jgi:aminoglycoside 6'-N-acetyltransferase I